MSREIKSSRAGVARGRMYLKARLGWLSGFPLQQSPGRVIWLALPRFGDRLPQEMAVIGRDLHRASRTWQKLTTRFPRALPQIVENLDHWQNGVPLLISLLSDAIHQGKAFRRLPPGQRRIRPLTRPDSRPLRRLPGGPISYPGD